MCEDCAERHLSKNYFFSLFLRGFTVEGNSGDQGVNRILVEASVSVNDFLAQKARPQQLCMYTYKESGRDNLNQSAAQNFKNWRNYQWAR
jgi:hypothetical protein